MNILGDFIARVNALYPVDMDNEELGSLLTTIKNQGEELTQLTEEVTKLQAALKKAEAAAGKKETAAKKAASTKAAGEKATATKKASAKKAAK